MVTKVIIPKLGAQLSDTAIIAEWLKKEGEKIEKGEKLFVVETEKITVEIEAPASGILRKILAPKGTVVPILGTVAFIAEPDEELPEI